jgi:hypothetical protein
MNTLHCPWSGDGLLRWKDYHKNGGVFVTLPTVSMVELRKCTIREKTVAIIMGRERRLTHW